MAALDTTRIMMGDRAPFGSKLLSKLVEWNAARVTRNQLNSLTDRELDDIGLTRADIETVARRTY